MAAWEAHVVCAHMGSTPPDEDPQREDAGTGDRLEAHGPQPEGSEQTQE